MGTEVQGTVETLGCHNLELSLTSFVEAGDLGQTKEVVRLLLPQTALDRVEKLRNFIPINNLKVVFPHFIQEWAEILHFRLRTLSFW